MIQNCHQIWDFIVRLVPVPDFPENTFSKNTFTTDKKIESQNVRADLIAKDPELFFLVF